MSTGAEKTDRGATPCEHPNDDASTAILEAVVGETPLIGTLRTLATSLGLTIPALRAGLRSLLEAEKIVVHAGPKGQLTIRPGRYVSSPLPALAPPAPRRGALPRVWIM